jgi:hypothetical protein
MENANWNTQGGRAPAARRVLVIEDNKRTKYMTTGSCN